MTGGLSGDNGYSTLMKCAATLFFAGLIAWLCWSYLGGGIMSLLLGREIAASEKISALQDFFLSWGILAPLVYVLFVAIEVVVAPIPGTMLYAPGGLVFGGFWGGLLSLTGNVLGAGIACMLMRIVGQSMFHYDSRTRLEKYRTLLNKQGIWIIFLLRVNPLTSSDLVSYAAGLTPMPLWKVMLGTLLGMAPLCWLQAYLAENIFAAFPALIYPLIVLCIIYALAIVVIILKFRSGNTVAATDESK